jgi:oligopeptidase B
MRTPLLRILLVVVCVVACCGAGGLAAATDLANALAPPVARVEPHVFREFGGERVDDYYWLNRREDPAVIAYLEAENAYAEAVLAPTAALQETLFAEITGRIKKDDDTVPYLDRGHWYTTRFAEGQEYPVFCRRADAPGAAEQVMLDVNALAEGHAFFQARGTAVSSGGGVLAWADDAVGRRLYTIRFKDLATGITLPDAIPNASGNHVWAEDDRTLFYTKKDPGTLRSYQVWRHTLGEDTAGDALVYQEDDETFAVGVGRTKSRRYVLITCYQSVSTEVRYVASDRPRDGFRVFQPRERDHEYSVDHLGDTFFVTTNWRARNFRLMTASEAATGKESWDELLPHREDALLQGVEVFRDWLVASERRDGLTRLRVRAWPGGDGTWEDLDFGEPAYMAYVGVNREAGTDVLRFGYESPTTPSSTYDYDMRTRRKTLLKRDEVLGGFSPDDYACERLAIEARDGARVPVTLVHRRDFPRDGTRPLLLYGYGSYGSSTEPDFDSARLSLLDRGFCYAIAHVRGGDELGRRWYEDGKLLNKMHTFEDFIDCGRGLVAAGYADPRRLYAMGGSAGGLLVGAVVNLAPDLFAGVVAQVPFVDVVTTMLDESIPLTTAEYDEWGDPHDEAAYRCMLAYSPYDNVAAAPRPHLLVTAGLHDSQVQYWEPAKWVAKLRRLKADDRRLLLVTNMEAGHGGASGRFQRHRETAREYAFLLNLAGMAR